MKSVEINPGIRCSALGFGCAPILGSVDGETARKALAAALDAGVTHFDLARSYGYGQAERFVGRFLGDRRGEVTITTKFGIRATPIARVVSPLKPVVRRLRQFVKRTKAVGAGGGGSAPTNVRLGRLLHERVPITPNAMRASLGVSLREMGTDYVDMLMIHEPLNLLVGIDDLLAEAEKLRDKGMIRAFGIAYMREQRSMHESYLDKFRVQQFDSPGAILDCEADPSFLFSPFRGKSANESEGEILKRLNERFPASVILCSMFSLAHIRQNAEALAA